MKSVSNDFLNVQNKHGIKYFYEIYLYRRYWNGSSYIWEESGTNLKPYLKERGIANIKWALDTEGLNVWRVANLQIELRNKVGKFEEGGGFFASPYIRYRSKIQIKVGYTLADGTTETCYIFSGFINKDVKQNVLEETIIFPLMGKDILLSETSAENVCNSVTGENIGIGDNSTTEFTTTYNGVGKVIKVYVDGVEVTEGKDYTISDLNTYASPAKITFEVAPSTGQAITCDYNHWYKDQTISYIVGKLLDKAGFTSGERTLGSMVFDYGRKYKVWDTKTQFEATAVRSRNLDTTVVEGNVQLKEEDMSDDVETNENVTINDSYPDQTAEINNTDDNWDINFDCDDTPENEGWNKTVYYGGLSTEESTDGKYHLVCNALTSIEYKVSIDNTQLSCFKCKLNNAVANNSFSFKIEGGAYKITAVLLYYGGDWLAYFSEIGSGTNVNLSKIIQETGASWNNYHTFDVMITDSGVAHLYVDGIDVLSGNASSSVLADNYTWTIDGNSGFEIYIDYIKGCYDEGVSPGHIIRGVLISDPIDLGVAPASVSNIGNPFLDYTSGGTNSYLTIAIQTSDSSDFSSGNDDWMIATVSAGVVTINPNTALKRYIRWQISMTEIDDVSPSSPTLNEIIMPGHMLSENIDCSADITAYNLFQNWGVDENGTRVYYSQSSSDASSWDSEVVISGTTISSTVKRYIRFRTVLTMTTTYGTTPKVYKQKFTRTQDTFNIALANFTDMTVQEALEEIAEFLDFEIGIDTEGKYFFRAKNTSESIDLELAQNTNIIAVDNFNAGWSRVKNRINVEHGDFKRLMTCESEGDSEPTSKQKYGEQALEISDATIGVDEDLDIAYGLAYLYRTRYKDPKKSMRLVCKMLPQLELSDTVNVNFKVPKWLWFWGQKDAYWGKPTIYWWDKNIFPLIDVVCNVVGIELDLKNFRSYITVREI